MLGLCLAKSIAMPGLHSQKDNAFPWPENPSAVFSSCTAVPRVHLTITTVLLSRSIVSSKDGGAFLLRIDWPVIYKILGNRAWFFVVAFEIARVLILVRTIIAPEVGHCSAYR